MGHINDISVAYTDRAIYKNLLYDKTPIHLSNEVDLRESFAKFADILQPIKEQVDRKEYFYINHIIDWGMKKHNIIKPLSKAREYSSSYVRGLTKDKRFIIPKIDKLGLRIICLEEWEHNRKIFIENIQNHPNLKTNMFKLWRTPRSFFILLIIFL